MITARGLNRATLHRQLLLERVDLTVGEAVEHLVGMQAQEPTAPYYGLWSRLRDFRPEELASLLTGRAAVRAPLQRATIHLVTAADHGRIEPVVREVVQRRFRSSPFRAILDRLDVEELREVATELIEERPRTRSELSDLLGQRWPSLDTESLGIAVTYLLPVVQVPPRGVWGRSGPAAWTTASSWLGDTAVDVDVEPDVTGLVRRHLAAFGPATVKDIQVWCGLTRLRSVVDGMELRTLRDEHGRELLDLADGPLPDPDTPAPARFLPPFDNVLLGHDDRTRVISDEDYRRGIVIGGKPTLLVDGTVHGTWRLTREGLDIEVFRPLTGAQRDDVLAEGERLLDLAPPGATEIRITTTS